MSVLLHPLISKIPLIAAQQVAFINPPDIELDFTGAANVADISFIDRAIRGILNDIIGGIIVLPNRLLVKVDPLCSVFDTYIPPLAVIRVKAEHADGFKSAGMLMKDVPDMQCTVAVGAGAPWKTKTVDNDETPEWNEEHDFVVSSYEQNVRIECLEVDNFSSEDAGSAAISIRNLISEGPRLTMKLRGSDKQENGATATFSWQLFDLSSDAASLAALAGAGNGVAPADGTNALQVGLLTILVAGVKQLPGPRDTISVMAKTTFHESKFQTPAVADAPGVDVNNPSFDAYYHVPLTQSIVQAAPEIAFEIQNHSDVIGNFRVPFAHVLGAPGMVLVSEHFLPEGGTFYTKVILNSMTPRTS
jgi:Ca2+-dependent lipid-binding protein